MFSFGVDIYYRYEIILVYMSSLVCYTSIDDTSCVFAVFFFCGVIDGDKTSIRDTLYIYFFRLHTMVLVGVI